MTNVECGAVGPVILKVVYECGDRPALVNRRELIEALLSAYAP